MRSPVRVLAIRAANVAANHAARAPQMQLTVMRTP